MVQKTTWLVSRKYDLFYLCGSAVFSLIFLGLFLLSIKFINVVEYKLELLFYLIFMGIFDHPHIFQTFSRIYYDKKEFNKRKIFHVLGPIVFIGVGMAAFHYGQLENLMFFGAILGSFHIMRQNIGFIKMYKRINKDYHKVDNFLDIGVYYLIYIFLTLLYYIWPPVKMNILVIIGFIMCGLLIIAFLSRQIYLFQKNKANIPKLTLYISTLVVHLTIIQFTHLHPIILTAIETIYHDFQYQGWMMHYQRTYFADKKHIVKKWLAASFTYGILAITISVISITRGPIFHMMTIPFLMIIIYHYVIEGFIWRFKKDQDLKQLLPVDS